MLGKKIALGSIFCAMAVCFTACGDDLGVVSPAVDYQDLAEPVWESGGTESTENTGNKENIGNTLDEGTLSPEGNGDDAVVPAVSTETGSGEITIVISAAGDVTLGNYFEQEYSYSFCQTYEQVEDKGYFFENVYDIFADDDMTIVNLEGPLTTSEDMREGQVYSIKGAPEYVNLLNYGNIEAVSMGNNHMLDYGTQGCRDTVDALEQAGVVYGYDSNLGIYETKGIRIGYVSVNEVSKGALVEKTLEEGIRLLQEDGVDLILACCHWGIEREYYPEEYQQILGRKCIDWGADLVIGHHPHVLQGIEEYQGKYIIYSLGNFCFGANRNPTDKDTMIFRQTFTFVDGQKAEDADIQVIPCSVSSIASRNDFKPTPAQGADAVRIIERINEYSVDYGVQFDEDGFLK